MFRICSSGPEFRFNALRPAYVEMPHAHSVFSPMFIGLLQTNMRGLGVGGKDRLWRGNRPKNHDGPTH